MTALPMTPHQMGSALSAAAEAGDGVEVTRLLKAGAPANWKLSVRSGAALALRAPRRLPVIQAGPIRALCWCRLLRAKDWGRDCR